MTDRAVIVDAATGALLRFLTMPPTMLALNIRPGESAFQIIDDDGLHIDGRYVIVSEAGAWAASGSAPPGLILPATTLEYVAT